MRTLNNTEWGGGGGPGSRGATSNWVQRLYETVYTVLSYLSSQITLYQGRRQGVCLGGGGKMAKCLAEHCASPEKGAHCSGGGGGAGSDTFFPDRNMFVAKLLP